MFAFALDDFESLMQNFSLAQTSSKVGNFVLGNVKWWKSQYHSYLCDSKYEY